MGLNKAGVYPSKHKEINLTQEQANLIAGALESGTYLKGKGTLVQTTGNKGVNLDKSFCVTGVMAQIAIACGVGHRRFSAKKKFGTPGYYYTETDGSGIYQGNLPPDILRFFGMKNTGIRGGVTVNPAGKRREASLEILNDTGVAGKSWSFKSLAKLIRSRYQDIGA